MNFQNSSSRNILPATGSRENKSEYLKAIKRTAKKLVAIGIVNISAYQICNAISPDLSVSF